MPISTRSTRLLPDLIATQLYTSALHHHIILHKRACRCGNLSYRKTMALLSILYRMPRRGRKASPTAPTTPQKKERKGSQQEQDEQPTPSCASCILHGFLLFPLMHSDLRMSLIFPEMSRIFLVILHVLKIYNHSSANIPAL